MAKERGIPLIALFGGAATLAGIALYFATRVKAVVITPEAALLNPSLTLEPTTPEEIAQREVAVSQAVTALNNYATLYPSSADQMQQIIAHIKAGTASEIDLTVAVTTINVYAQYVAAGGTDTYEEFTIWHWGSMPEEYKSQIEEARRLATEAYYDEAIAYLPPPDQLSDQQLAYITSNAYPHLMKEAYLRKYPEAEVLFVAPVVEPVVTETFTATVEQLQALETTATSKEYTAAIDTAYQAAVTTAKQLEASTGESYCVSWSSGGGYSAMSTSDSIAYGGPT